MPFADPLKPSILNVNVNVIATSIPDILIIEPKVFGDAGGFIYESFNQKAVIEATGLDVSFVQDNHSRSAKDRQGCSLYESQRSAHDFHSGVVLL